MKKVKRNELINCMVKNAEGECTIGIVQDLDTEEVEIISYENGWIDTYCNQNRKELIESFEFKPIDIGYDGATEETTFVEADADYWLDQIEDKFESFELV